MTLKLKITTLKTFWFCLFTFSLATSAQNYVLDYSLGNFNFASAFSITSSGFFYIADDGDDSLIKLDTLGNVVKEIGGYGWGESAFDTPSDIIANSLNVYVCDKQNHRVQSFDKDLNFISELYTRESDITEERFGYPLSCGLSSMGDLYVLDSENIRVLKFDLFGNFIQNFGGYDWGSFSLKNPKKLAVNSDNSVLVLDDSVLVIYDQFGNGKDKIKLGNSFSSLKISSGTLILNNDDEIYMGSFGIGENILSKINLIGAEDGLKILSCSIFNNKLYILTPTEILVFEKSSS
jgi:hypothetical protein